MPVATRFVTYTKRRKHSRRRIAPHTNRRVCANLPRDDTERVDVAVSRVRFAVVTLLRKIVWRRSNTTKRVRKATSDRREVGHRAANLLQRRIQRRFVCDVSYRTNSAKIVTKQRRHDNDDNVLNRDSPKSASFTRASRVSNTFILNRKQRIIDRKTTHISRFLSRSRFQIPMNNLWLPTNSKVARTMSGNETRFGTFF